MATPTNINRPWMLLAGALCTIALHSSAFAQNGQTPGTGQTTTPTSQTPKSQAPTAQTPTPSGTSMTGQPSLQRGDRLIGAQITDASGAPVGKIEDVILRRQGEIAYAIVSSTDGGTKMYPVPWSQLSFSSGADSASGMNGDAIDATRKPFSAKLRFNKDRFKEAPSFERGQWPKGNDVTSYQEAARFYGTYDGATGANPGASGSGSTSGLGQTTEASAMKTPEYIRGSQLSNLAITDAQGTQLGTINQVVYDPAAGRLNYAALSLSGASGGQKLVALPWDVIHPMRVSDRDVYQVSLDANRLQSAPVYKNGEQEWNEMTDRRYLDQLYNYYSVRPYWNGDNRNAPNSREPGDKQPRDGNNPPRDGNNPPRDGNNPPRDGNNPPRDGNKPPHDDNNPPRDGNKPPH